MQIKKNDIITLNIHSIASDGNGVGNYNGMVVFVAFSAPEDELSVRIVKVSKNHAFGIIDKIIKPSPHRIQPHCDIFGKCGGCAFAHLTYEQELLQKQNFVKDAFERIGGIEVKDMPPIIKSDVFRYRNKAQYPLFKDEQTGEIKAGFYAARSHRIIVCDDCKLQPEIINNITNYACKLFTRYNLSVYNMQTGKGLLRHIYLRYCTKTNDVLLCFVINGHILPNAKQICEELQNEFKQIVGIVINVNSEKTNVILGKQCKVISGNGVLNDELCGVNVALNALSFYQVNTKGANKLYESVIKFANMQSHEVLLDLYCGAGTIGLAVQKATPCKKLIGVEIVGAAIESAKQNAAENNVENASFICADAAFAAKKLLEDNFLPDVIILDPPRKGCDEKTLNSVLKMNPKRIVMVSCNASSAARDIKVLTAENYEIKAVQCVDLFARTRHVECVCLLKKRSKE